MNAEAERSIKILIQLDNPFKLILIKYYIDFQKIDHTRMISDKRRQKSWINLPILISKLTGSIENLFNHMIITYALTKFANQIGFE